MESVWWDFVCFDCVYRYFVHQGFLCWDSVHWGFVLALFTIAPHNGECGTAVFTQKHHAAPTGPYPGAGVTPVASTCTSWLIATIGWNVIKIIREVIHTINICDKKNVNKLSRTGTSKVQWPLHTAGQCAEHETKALKHTHKKKNQIFMTPPPPPPPPPKKKKKKKKRNPSRQFQCLNYDL